MTNEPTIMSFQPSLSHSINVRPGFPPSVGSAWIDYQHWRKWEKSTSYFNSKINNLQSIYNNNMHTAFYFTSLQQRGSRLTIRHRQLDPVYQVIPIPQPRVQNV